MATPTRGRAAAKRSGPRAAAPSSRKRTTAAAAPDKTRPRKRKVAAKTQAVSQDATTKALKEAVATLLALAHVLEEEQRRGTQNVHELGRALLLWGTTQTPRKGRARK